MGDAGSGHVSSVSVLGLGKLGAPIAACLASVGFDVIGVDVLESTVALVNDGEPPVQEPGLEELMRDHKDRLRGTLDIADAVAGSQVTFVIVPTPSTPEGDFSVEFAAKACASLARGIASKGEYHVVVLSSTVLPGVTRETLVKVMEQESGLMCGRDFGVCYSPEFIALGSVIRDFLNPDFHLIGEFDERSGETLERVLRQVTGDRVPVRRMSLENAELAKVSINAFVTLKISFANLLADFCEQIRGGDIDEVTGALGLDSRIGAKYLTGGLGFGGPCFPRDNVALASLGNRLGLDVGLLDSNQRFNTSRNGRIIERLEGSLSAHSRIAVIGLAYKSGTGVLEEAPGIEIGRALSAKGHRVVGYDRFALSFSTEATVGLDFVSDDLEEACRGVEVVLVVSRDPSELQHLESLLQSPTNETVLVVDFWRSRPLWKQIPGLEYQAIGA